jgi:hypothetical protein
MLVDLDGENGIERWNYIVIGRWKCSVLSGLGNAYRFEINEVAGTPISGDVDSQVFGQKATSRWKSLVIPKPSR